MGDLLRLDPTVHDDPRVASLARAVDLLADALDRLIAAQRALSTRVDALREELDAVEEYLDVDPSPPLWTDVHVRDALL